MLRLALLRILLSLPLLLTVTVGFAYPQSPTSAKKPVSAKMT